MKLFNIFLASTILVSGLSATELKRSMKVIPLDPKYLSTEYGGTNHASAVLADGVGVYSTSFDEYARAISYLNGKYGDDALKDKKSLKEYVLDNGTIADKELAKKLNLNAAQTQKSNPGDSCDDGDSTTMNDMYTDDAFTCVGKIIIGSECDDGNAGTIGDAYVDNAFTCKPKNSVIGATCDDLNPQTENDVYTDINFTCKGTKISNAVQCYGDPIGSNILVDGVEYLVVENGTGTYGVSNPTNINRADTICTSNVTTLSGYTLYYPNPVATNSPLKTWNKDISHWDVSNVTSMYNLFTHMPLFDQPIGDWDVSKVVDFRNTFGGSSNFNQDIGDWDTSSAIYMGGMFINAKKFNQDIGSWNVSNVRDMDKMFAGATAFNQNINNWNVGKVTNFKGMFLYTTSYNQPMDNWDVSKATSFMDMFTYASLFNQDLSKWNTMSATSPTGMDNMFYATPMKQDLSKWCVPKINYAPSNFGNTTGKNPVWKTCPAR